MLNVRASFHSGPASEAYEGHYMTQWWHARASFHSGPASEAYEGHYMTQWWHARVWRMENQRQLDG